MVENKSNVAAGSGMSTLTRKEKEHSCYITQQMPRTSSSSSNKMDCQTKCQNLSESPQQVTIDHIVHSLCGK